MAAARTVNVRFLAVLVGALAVLGPSVYFVNAYQVRRHADTLKRRADQALHEERYEEAAKFFHLYLIQHPEDIEARIGWGKALDKKPAKTFEDMRQAFENFQFVLGLEPDHDDIRRRQVDLALETRQPNEAIVHIQKLLAGSRKNDGPLEQLLALCYVLRGEDDQAVTYYEKAIDHDPLHLTSYVQLANLYLTRRKEAAKANEVKERMLANNGDQWEAHLAAAAMLRYQRLADEEEVKKALELAPDKAETIVEAAATAQRQHKLDEARALLERGLKLYPKNPDMYYRLARVEMEAGRPDKAEECLRRGLPEIPDQGQNSLVYLLALVLIQRGDLATAEKEIANLKNRGAAEIYVNDLRARVHMKKNEWVAASRLFEEIRLLVAQQPDFAFQVEFLLGSCYEHQRLFDRALENYEQALRLKPDSPESLRARRGKASALLALGKVEEALAEFRQILPKDPTVALPMAQLLTERNRRLDPEKRDWKEVDNALSYAKRAAPDSKEVAIFQAELAQIRQNTQQGFDLLKKERDKDPSQPEPWMALIRMAETQGKPADTLALIDLAEKQLGDRVDLRLARARHWLRVGGEPAPTALAKLEQDTGKFNPAERAGFLTGLADLYLRTGNFKEPKRLLSQLADTEPKNLPVRQALFELAFLTGAEAELEPLVREIRRIEGEDGTLWRYGEACRIILAARGISAQGGNPDREKLAEARALLARVAAQRPRWGRVALREAELTELEGNLQAALDLYQRALSLGEREPVSFRRAIYLLYQARRFREAENIVATLQEQTPNLPDDLKRLNISMLSQLGNHEAAVEEAAKLVQAGAKDPAGLFLYAQALDLAGKPEGAEKAYRAVLQSPGIDKLPDIWVQFVRFLVRSGQKSKAEGVVQEAEKQIPPSVLAQCYEALNQPGKAEEQHLNALKTKPAQQLETLRNLVSFYERIGQLERAEPYLRRLLEPETRATPTDMETARRALAVVLASKTDYEKLQEGLALLEQNAKGGVFSLLDQHAKAKIYAKHPYYWRQAIELFEQLQGQAGGLTLEEQLALASLYEYYGPNEWVKGRRLYQSVLASNADNPAIIHLCARSLLRHNDAEEIPNWLEKLQKQDGPQSLRVLEIRVRLLKAQGKLEEGAKFLKEYAERPDATDANLETAAALLEEFAKPKAAEDLYRKLAEKPGRADKVLMLAAFLGRQGRAPDIQEALDLCDRAWKTCAPDKVAFIAVAILNGIKTPSQQQVERVERGLMEAVHKSPKSLALLFYLAGLRSLEWKYDEAEKLYRQIIEQDPRNALARNNLAWLLAAHDGKTKAAEALDLVNQAIRLVGPSAELLDTRAFIYLKMETADEALKDLKKALEEEALKQNPSAVLYFHLALAQEMLRDPGAAVSLRRAQRLKLKVHPLEQQSYERLVRVLAQT
jgi:cellulose synthase operon protein C